MIQHDFGGKSFELDYRKLPKNYVFPKQVHEANVLLISSIEQAEELAPYTSEVGATVTSVAGVVLCVSTADCVPIILADEENGIIAAVHAGWKSACKGIIYNVIDDMRSLGANPDNMKAYIGPSLGKESFECEADMMDEFLSMNKSNEQFFEKQDDVKYLFDIKAFCAKSLNNAGISSVEVSDIDTYTDDNYHSYRGFEANNPDIGYEYGKYRNLTTVEIK